MRLLSLLIGRLRPSQAMQLSAGLLLLVASTLFLADVLNLRGNVAQERLLARKVISESLAVQVSMLATLAEPADLQLALKEFVGRSTDALAASLMRADGEPLAQLGDQALLTSSMTHSTESHVVVPIYNETQLWGELRVAFRPIDSIGMDIQYYGFVMGGCLILFLFFLHRALVQLDPSQVVPERVNSAFNLFGEGVLVLDARQRILLANDAAAATIGGQARAQVGRLLDDWPWRREAGWRSPWAVALETGETIVDQTLILDLDPPRIVLANCTPVGEDDGQHTGVMVTLDDMTALHHKNQELSATLTHLRESQESITRKNIELETLATRDPLTGLLNRRALMERFEEEFVRTREALQPLSCIMVDIDHFKLINDTHGHTTGDEVICAVAQALLRNGRDSNIVGRFGGEEFVLILPETSASEAMAVAERIRQQIQDLANDVTVPVDRLTASLGVAERTDATAGIDDLLERSDEALYAAKGSGRNRVVCHHPDTIAAMRASRTRAGTQASSDETTTSTLCSIVEKQNREMETLRTHDALTGVPKRQLFMHAIETELVRAERFDRTVGVMSLEIRDLPALVTMLGHAQADLIVMQFIERIQESLRRSDLVVNITDSHSVSRLTDNEYGILLSDLDMPDEALPVVTRIRHLMSTPLEVGGEKMYVGSNIGIAVSSRSNEDAQTLLDSAIRARHESATYPEKIAYCFASPELEVLSREYLKLESDLYDAMKDESFEVYYQPKFDLAQRTIGSVEALIRWRHPERGFVSPVEFIPIAEANGLIHPLFRFVLSSTLQQLLDWDALGLDPISVSVNVSASQLRDPSLVETVLSAIKQAGLDTSRIEIELTETCVIQFPQRARIALTQLRDAGVRISMDDFGTGYTSLALLADLPLDSVKIDRSFVIAMENSERSRAIVESIISMAHTLKLKVVGEGVETSEQLSTLAALGCNEIQGYLISRPLPSAEISTLLLREASDGAQRLAG